MRIVSLWAVAVPLMGTAEAIAYAATDPGSIRAAAKTTADNLMGFYNFAQVGVLPPPYWWWETAGLFGGMIEYWAHTGDAAYNDHIARALISQKGPNNDFMMPAAEGNDDQGWWGLAAMTAAEYGLPNQPGQPAWIDLAKNVFNRFEARWDMSRCNGGLKWKIDAKRDPIGYHYKSTISNGLAFQLAARLARFTGDQRYFNWASNSYDWVRGVGLIDEHFNVFDGTDDAKGTGCVDVNHDQWSYNVGAFMYGAAVLADATGDRKWSDRAAGLFGNSVSTFFRNRVMLETRCEPGGTCNVDQLSFKAYLTRWIKGTAMMIPSFQPAIMPFLRASSEGAARSCVGGGNRAMCGSRWSTGSFDGSSGVGQQLAALDAMLGMLAPNARRPMGAGRRFARRDLEA